MWPILPATFDQLLEGLKTVEDDPLADLFRKEEPKKEAPKAPLAPAAAPVAAPAPVGKLSPAKFDDETVAVITAAIAAVRGEGYPFQIKRIVRVKQ